VNPSWEIARSLPEYLPPLRAKSTAHIASAGLVHGPKAALPPVRLLVYPEAVRVNYEVVRGLVPRLWSGEATPGPLPTSEPPRRIDYAIHIGMAGPALHYCLEQRGDRDGYALPDVDRQLLGDEKRHEELGEDWIWHNVPHELDTDIDVEDVMRRWKAHSPVSCLTHLTPSQSLSPLVWKLGWLKWIATPLPQDNSDLRISKDAGRYLCDFIYFSSLAYLWQARQFRRVVFLHVPS